MAATVTSKGQITIPKSVRDSLALRTGDRVAFRFTGDGRVYMEPENVDLMSLRGSLKSDVRGISIEDMARAVREHATKP